jgi:hypothetical protein
MITHHLKYILDAWTSKELDCLMAHTTCLVCRVSTVNGCSKKPLDELSLIAGT